MKAFTNSTSNIRRVIRMAKKQSGPQAICSADMNYEWHDGEIDNPLYTICKIDNYYHVLYYGCCGMYGAETFEECKKWVSYKLDEYKARQAHDRAIQLERKKKHAEYIESLRREGVM